MYYCSYITLCLHDIDITRNTNDMTHYDKHMSLRTNKYEICHIIII